MSMLSGKIGIPEGAFKKLANKDVESAIEFLIENKLQLIEVIQEVVGGGGGIGVGCRWLADGTKVAGTGITSVTRTGVGTYRIVIDGTAQTVGGYVQMWPVPGVSGDAGDGGDGVSPFKAYDSYQEKASDAETNNVWDYNESNGKFYLLGSDSDDVWIHDDANWTAAPTQVDADGVDIRVQPLSGCLSREGGYTWITGDGFPIRVVRNSDNTVFNFGGTPTLYIIAATDNLNALAGSGVSGPRIWVSNGTTILAYDPNIVGESLGSVQLTYSPNIDHGSYSVPLRFDNEGYLWNLQGGAFYQINPTLGEHASHSYPTETPTGETLSGSLGGGSRITFDPLRRVWYVVLQTSDPNSYLWTYSDWQNGVANSGRWEFVKKLGAGFASIWYEPAQDVLFVSHYSAQRVMRFSGYPKTLIDVITVDDSAGNTSEIERDLQSTYTCFYKSDETGDYGYVIAQGGATQYFIKISYNGPALSVGSGGSNVASVLVPMFSVINATTVDVSIYRTLSPPQKADAQGSVVIDYTPA